MSGGESRTCKNPPMDISPGVTGKLPWISWQNLGTLARANNGDAKMM